MRSRNCGRAVKHKKTGKVQKFLFLIWQPNLCPEHGSCLRPCVNITNILRAAFLYKSFARSFMVLRFKVCSFLAEKYRRKSCTYNVGEIDCLFVVCAHLCVVNVCVRVKRERQIHREIVCVFVRINELKYMRVCCCVRVCVKSERDREIVCVCVYTSLPISSLKA